FDSPVNVTHDSALPHQSVKAGALFSRKVFGFEFKGTDACGRRRRLHPREGRHQQYDSYMAELVEFVVNLGGGWWVLGKDCLGGLLQQLDRRYQLVQRDLAISEFFAGHQDTGRIGVHVLRSRASWFRSRAGSKMLRKSDSERARS